MTIAEFRQVEEKFCSLLVEVEKVRIETIIRLKKLDKLINELESGNGDDWWKHGDRE